MTNDTENGGIGIRLLKGGKRRISRIIFSRLVIMLALVLLQIAVAVVVLGWFRDYVPHFTALQVLFSIAMVFYLFNAEMDATGKLTWMFLISLFPIPGSIFLFYSKSNIGYRRLAARMRETIEETKTLLPSNQAVLRKLHEEGGGLDDLHRYIARTGCYPVWENTAADYYPLGDDVFPVMLEELEGAKEFIFLEFFIIGEGDMWGEILELLARKAAEGVDVRVMYDGMCETSLLPHDYPARMEALGIACKSFLPLRPMVSTYYNYRDHRKIMVIDGRTAFTGGVNLADEYINRAERFGHWKDTAVRIRGDAAASFTLMFLQMWHMDDAESGQWTDKVPVREWERFLKAPDERPKDAEGYVMPFGDNPLDDEKVGESVYMDILYRATRYVHIMTPYLILDGELTAALRFVAERGIDVKLILPGVPDKRTAYALAKSHYAELLRAGVRIYEYTPGFVHAKVFVSDDRRAVVGTINLDYRSLYHHFECAAYLYRVPCIRDIAEDFEGTRARSREVLLSDLPRTEPYYKIMGRVLKLVAPLM